MSTSEHKLPKNIRREVVSHIIRFDLLRRREFRDTFLSVLPPGKFMAAAGKQARTLWEVIVALSEAYLAGRSMAASDIHLAAGLSRSTARRYVRMLEQLGIFLRRPNMADKRRVLIELTYPFSKRVDQYVNECFEEFEDLITIHHDCERLKAKNALKEIDAHVHLLTDSTVEGIYGIDLGGNCTFANSSCLNSLGYEEHDDLLGKNMHALRESEKRKRFILQSALDAIVTMDEDGRVLEFNPSAERIFGYTMDEAKGKKVVDLIIPPKLRVKHRRGLKKFLKSGKFKFFDKKIEIVAIGADGVEFPVELTVTPIQLKGQRLFTAFISDITERKQVEDRIKASLEEKEVLLGEIHHRVKNNLQVISSMLRLQANAENNTHTVEVLRGSFRRVMLMAKINESLYRYDDLSVINARDFLNTLVTDTKMSTGVVSEHLSFHIDVDDIPLDVDHANAYGQIVSELLSNCLKHAFADGQPGNIDVSLHQRDGGVTELTVADDGKGLPEDFGLQQTKTLGLQLVRSLAAKLGGAINIDGSSGTRVQINFPEQPS